MRTNCSFNLESLGYWNKIIGTANSCEQFSHRELHLAALAQLRHAMQRSLQHGGENGGPTSCECYERYSRQNASGKEKYGQILQFLLNTNYLLCCNYAKITSFFAFRSPLIVSQGTTRFPHQGGGLPVKIPSISTDKCINE